MTYHDSASILSPKPLEADPHREDNPLVDIISGWPTPGATSDKPQLTLPTTDQPRFYQRPLSGRSRESAYDSPRYVHSRPATVNYGSKLIHQTPGDVNDVEYLATKRRFSATTQSAWDEVNWNKKLNASQRPLPDVFEKLAPDPVAESNRSARYHSKPGDWQRLGNSWDYMQKRDLSWSYPNTRMINFLSPYSMNNQIPGYTGHIGVKGSGELDDINSRTTPLNTVRLETPFYTPSVRRANIPGYTGCLHWKQTNEAHQFMDHSTLHSTTTPRSFPKLSVEYLQRSPFTRTGVLSKMVTLTSPYNPFKKLE